jgi:hypothetical protein
LKAEKCAENVAQTRDPEACAVSCAIIAGGRKGKDRRFLHTAATIKLSCPLRFVITCKSLRFHLKSGMYYGLILIKQRKWKKKNFGVGLGGTKKSIEIDHLGLQQ